MRDDNKQQHDCEQCMNLYNENDDVDVNKSNNNNNNNNNNMSSKVNISGTLK
jgi:hypothetical protein